ncbi:MAG: hypothetical protein U5M23_08545 [Marinagarivorans sp.]|nr:hypothetical protein [Marinagarivorans sp.]
MQRPRLQGGLAADKVIAHVKERAGTQFDPQLIAAFLENIDRFVAILNDNPNEAD